MAEIVNYTIQFAADTTALTKVIESVQGLGGVSIQSSKQVKDVTDALRGVDGAAPAVKKTRDEVEGLGSGIVKLYAGMGIIKGVVSSVQGAFAPFLAMLREASGLLDMSAATGETVSDLIVLQRVLENAGKSGADVLPLFARMTTALNQAGNAGSPAAKAFRELRINTEDFARLRPSEQVEALQQAFSRLGEARQRALATRLFGTQGVEMLPLLREGDSFQKARAETTEYAAMMEKNAVKMKALNDEISRQGVRVQAVWVRVLDMVIPMVQLLVAGMEKIPTSALAAGLITVASAATILAGSMTIKTVFEWIRGCWEWVKGLRATTTAINQETAALARNTAARRTNAATGTMGVGRGTTGTIMPGGSSIASMAGAGLALYGIGYIIDKIGEGWDLIGKINKEQNRFKEDIRFHVDQLKRVDGIVDGEGLAAAQRAIDQALTNYQRLAKEGNSVGFGYQEWWALRQELMTQKELLASKGQQVIYDNTIRKELEEQAQAQRRVNDAWDAARGPIGKMRQAWLEAQDARAETPAQRLAVNARQAQEVSARWGLGAMDAADLERKMMDRIAHLRQQMQDGSTFEVRTDEGRKVTVSPAQDAAQELGKMQEDWAKVQELVNAQRDLRKAAAQEAAATQRAQLDIELHNLEQNYAARRVTDDEYYRQRKAIMEKTHAAEAMVDDFPLSRMRHELENLRLDAEVREKIIARMREDQNESEEARRPFKESEKAWDERLNEVRRPQEADRLARIGAIWSGGGGIATNYARRSADGIEKLVQKFDRLSVSILHLGGGVASFAP